MKRTLSIFALAIIVFMSYALRAIKSGFSKQGITEKIETITAIN